MKADANRLPVASDLNLAARAAEIQTRIVGRLQLGLYSRITRHGLRRDLDVLFERPAAKIPIAVRELAAADVPLLLSPDDARGNRIESLDIARRRAFVDQNVDRCFVAVDLRSDTPCYMQWLISAADANPIRHQGNFPELAPDEALLEDAYTPVKYRGLGIMAAAMAQIAERAADIGARYVLTFVADGNIPSLKGCQRAGFYPHLLHSQVQMAFGLIKRNVFEKLPEGDPRRNLRF